MFAVVLQFVSRVRRIRLIGIAPAVCILGGMIRHTGEHRSFRVRPGAVHLCQVQPGARVLHGYFRRGYRRNLTAQSITLRCARCSGVNPHSVIRAVFGFLSVRVYRQQVLITRSFESLMILREQVQGVSLRQIRAASVIVQHLLKTVGLVF